MGGLDGKNQTGAFSRMRMLLIHALEDFIDADSRNDKFILVFDCRREEVRRYLMNVPLRSSAIACRISSGVFMTNGP